MIAVDLASAIPVFEQIRIQIAGEIRSGRLPEGARLPSVRQLASDLGIAPGTVAKSFSALELDGLVTTSRASGTRVAPDAALDDATRASVRQFVHTIDQRTLSLDSLLSAVRAEWDASRPLP